MNIEQCLEEDPVAALNAVCLFIKDKKMKHQNRYYDRAVVSLAKTLIREYYDPNDIMMPWMPPRFFDMDPAFIKPLS